MWGTRAFFESASSHTSRTKFGKVEFHRGAMCGAPGLATGSSYPLFFRRKLASTNAPDASSVKVAGSGTLVPVGASWPESLKKV